MWKRQRAKGEERPGIWRAVVVRGFFGVAALICVGLFLCFGLRTPLVLGPLVGPSIKGAAEAAQVDLEIGSMGGVGWTGVRLYQVAASYRSGEDRIFSELGTVDVYPDLWASLKAGRPKVERVIVEEGTLRLERIRAKGQRSEATKEQGGVVDKAAQGRWLQYVADQVDLELHRVEVTVLGMPQAVAIDEARARVSPGAAGLEELELQGRALGRAFSFIFDEDRFVADLSHLDFEEISRGSPVEVELEAVALHRDEFVRLWQQRSLRGIKLHLEGLALSKTGAEVARLEVEHSEVLVEGADISWRAPEAQLVYPGGVAQLRLAELARREDVDGLSFQGQLLSEAGGHIEVEGQWHRPTSLVTLNAWAHDFHWEGAAALGEGWPIQEGRFSGAFHGDVDLIHGLVSLDGRMKARDLAVELAILANQPLLFEEVELALPLTVDLRGRALSVAGGELSFGEVATLGFYGHVIDAGESFAFELAMRGENIDAAHVATSLPAPLLGALVETELEGRFGVSISTEGHTVEPESLVLEVGFAGEVEVGDELVWAGLEQRFEGEDGEVPKLFRSEHHPHRPLDQHHWTRLGDLPAHVPAAILSAEDATFFQHEGLDWTGLRMAMVQNIREGALVRGGSTISQQVAKNLFLTQDRTISRKLQEAFLTWRVESVLSKEQILELYLNVAQWGAELHGLGAAAVHYFEKEAGQLTALEAATLAAILPNPTRFGGALKMGYLPSSREGKIRRVLVNMRYLEQLEWPEYHAAIAELEQGRLGTLEFERCADDEEAPPELMSCSDIGGGGDAEYELAGYRDPAGWVPLTH